MSYNFGDGKHRILVTGACGSVGSAIVRHLLLEGHTVCAFDQSEDGLFKLNRSLHQFQGQLRLFLGDIRNLQRLMQAMEGVDYVFHCAALKHVEISEYNPFEASQTNIIGTQNVIDACLEHQVKKALFTSSDKAVNPTSTMGASKLLGERLFIAANHHVGSRDTAFSIVRFGNVLNSNGSVLEIFRRQLASGEPITITSVEMTRFFITMQQAVGLCVEAIDRACGGEIFVKNMGACDILTLARALNNKEVELQYQEIGCKPGEKLYEELVTDVECLRTVFTDNTYAILPETVDMMPDSIKRRYSAYDKLDFVNSVVRSDVNLLTVDEVNSLLKSAQ